MNSKEPAKKYSYYLSFTTQIFLGAKELLKSMPAFYNRVYFSSKYASALWSGNGEETFTNVTLLTKGEDIDRLRQIIKTNFLYIAEWDSVRFTETGLDYGFSFIAGNIKYILMPFYEAENGYLIRSYDVDTGNCYDTSLACNKQLFLNTSVKENGEIVKTCDFNLEYMTNENTHVHLAEKKAQAQNMATFKANEGYAFVNLIAILLLSVVSVSTVLISYYLISSGLLS